MIPPGTMQVGIMSGNILDTLREFGSDYLRAIAEVSFRPEINKILAVLIGFYGLLTFLKILRRFRPSPNATRMGMTYAMKYNFNLALVLYVILTGFESFQHAIKFLVDWKSYYDAYQPILMVLNFAVVILVGFNFASMTKRAIVGDYETHLSDRLKYLARVANDRGMSLHELIFFPIALLLPWREVLLGSSELLKS